MTPNVVVLILDAARRDALEPYGAAPGASPAIAQLARRGTALAEVYATGCWTAPSHASIFSGLLPRAMGLAGVSGGTPGDVRAQLLAERDRLLPVALGAAGYRTIAASANVWISPSSGFDEGFEDFLVADSGRQAGLDRHSLRARLGRWREAVLARADDGAADIERALFTSLTASRGPFFCFVNLVEAHSPYLAPRPFATGGPLERIRAMNLAARHYTLGGVWRTCLGGSPISASELAILRRQYAASIQAMDAWVGRLAEVLDAAGQLDETVLIVTADHGENFGEGGLIAHGLSLDNRLIHVPFVVAGPVAEEALPTSLAGLPRLVAESAGIASHPWPADDLPAGVGVAQHDPPVLRGDPRLSEVMMGEWGLGEEAVRRLTTPLTCAVSGNRKLLVDGERERWLDLEHDPLETDPVDPAGLGAEEQEQLEVLRAALHHPAVTRTRPFQRGAGEQAAPDETAKLEERMRLLGYM